MPSSVRSDIWLDVAPLGLCHFISKDTSLLRSSKTQLRLVPDFFSVSTRVPPFQGGVAFLCFVPGASASAAGLAAGLSCCGLSGREIRSASGGQIKADNIMPRCFVMHRNDRVGFFTTVRSDRPS